MLHGVPESVRVGREGWEEGLLPAESVEQDGEIVQVPREKFTSFWRDYVQKSVVRHMLEYGQLLNPPADSLAYVALTTQNFQKYLQHCIERKPALVSLFASQNGKQDREVIKPPSWNDLRSGTQVAHHSISVWRAHS